MYPCLKRNKRKQGKGDDVKFPSVSSQPLTTLEQKSTERCWNIITTSCYWSYLSL